MRTAPVLAAATAGGLLLALSACGGGGGQPAASSTAPATPGTTSAPSGARSGTLTSAETRDLTYVRGLEKAGTDAYQVFAGRYSQPVFANLASSQKTQSAAVTSMMAAFGVPDPLRTTPAGQFTDSGLQQLYTAAVDSGSGSPQNALRSMQNYERKAASDLGRIRSGTSQPDLRRLYGNLEQAATRHIAAITTALGHASPSAS